MQLIQPSTEIIVQQPEFEGMYKHIELCGRVCYKSEDKITQDSAMKFVERIIKSGHGSVLEHGTVYLKIPYDNIMEYVDPQNPYDRDILSNTWTKYVIDYGNDVVYISSNYRWIIENNLESLMQYSCEPTLFHHKRTTVKFVCSRAISHELVKHRVFSFSQESQRYCNYSLDKFSNAITFIEPLFSSEEGSLSETSEAYDNAYEVLCSAWEDAEAYYFTLIDAGFKPQEAREVLPNSTKTEVIMTGFNSDWEQFFELRTSARAHPEMRRLANVLKEKFKPL